MENTVALALRGLNHDVCGLDFSNYANVPTLLHILASTTEKSTNGSGFLVSYCWLLQHHGGPLEVSDMDPLVVLLL